MKEIFSNPNTLTLFRIAAVPLIVILLLFPGRLFAFVAAVLFTVAAITDFLDGFFARRKGLVSTFLVSLGWIPGWIVCIIIGRELAVTGLRNIAAQQGLEISSSRLGKYKTGFQIAAIIPLLIHYQYFTIDFHEIGFVFLWAALALTLLSGADYFIKFRGLMQA